MFQGEKVFLRQLEPVDLTLIQRWYMDADLARYIWPGVMNPLPTENVIKWYNRLINHQQRKYFLICELVSKNPLGLVGIEDISWRSRKGDLFIIIGEKKYWGQGYGTEAAILFLGYCFRLLNLRRVALEVFEYNQRAIKSYEKVGFQKEGYVRRSVFKDGQYWGEFIMAIFRDDYFQRYPLKWN